MADATDEPDAPAELVYFWAPRGEERVFDLAAWPVEARTMAEALLAEDGLEHRWEGDAVVVDAPLRPDVAAILDTVVEASRPRLDDDEARTAYELGDWPDYELEVLAQALEDAGILHEWSDDGELYVYERDEAQVDELFDRLDLHGPDPGIELDGDQLNLLLTDLMAASDKMSKDAADPDGVLAAHRLIGQLEELAVPYGVNADSWAALVGEARSLREMIEAEAATDDEQVPDEVVSATAGGLRDRLRRLL